jgi:hypothetical protein
VARFVREPFERHVAEAAITVADVYHGQGAGTLLLGALSDRARSEGIEVFRSYVLDGNHAMLEVFDHLGAERARENETLWRVDLPLPRGLDDLPDSAAGRAFLAAARGQRRLVSLFPPIWGQITGRRRRRGEADEAGEPAVVSPEEELAHVRDDLAAWLDRRGR